MAARKRNHYEDKHLKNPAFLEKYFQKRPVWTVTATLIALLMVWALTIAIPDLLGIKDDPDFNSLYDLAIIFGSIFMLYFVIDEYRFYQKELWHKKK